MLNDEICNLRNKLNKSIEDGEDRSLEDVKQICYKDMNCSGPYFYFANYCKKLAFIV